MSPKLTNDLIARRHSLIDIRIEATDNYDASAKQLCNLDLPLPKKTRVFVSNVGSFMCARTSASFYLEWHHQVTESSYVLPFSSGLLVDPTNQTTYQAMHEFCIIKDLVDKDDR